MPTSPTPITALPTPPSRDDSANFATRGDAFLAALPTFRSETNSTATNVYNNAVEVSSNASTVATNTALAVNSASAAASVANAPIWVSGTTYALGAVAWSPANGYIYRRIVAGAGTTDPSADPTNWTNVMSFTFPGGNAVSTGTISETVSGAQYLVASQFDVGTSPQKIPLNQYLGTLAYEDSVDVALNIGAGITAGTGTICRASARNSGGIYRMTILIDLTGLNSGGTAGDIIGANGTALPCYIARLPTITVLGGRMTCLETPAGGDTDIDLHAASQGTGVEDQAITALTQTQIINAGAQTVGTVTYFSADPAANRYFYLVGQGTANATYTAGRFLIEIFGVAP